MLVGLLSDTNAWEWFTDFLMTLVSWDFFDKERMSDKSVVEWCVLKNESLWFNIFNMQNTRWISQILKCSKYVLYV